MGYLAGILSGIIVYYLYANGYFPVILENIKKLYKKGVAYYDSKRV
jgi:hypothetical protein